MTSSDSSSELDVYLAHALPTRSRPQGHLDGEAAWREFRRLMLAIMAEAQDQEGRKAAWLAPRLSESSPEAPTDVEGAYAWIEAVAQVAGSQQRESKQRCLTYLVQWLLARGNFKDVIAAVLQADSSLIHGANPYRTGLWASPFDIALRAALVKTPEASYDEIVADCQRASEVNRNGSFSAFLAFVLADDRPERHDLQPLAELDSARMDPAGAAPSLAPLIIDSQPSSVSSWRSGEVRYLVRFVDCDISDIGGIEAGATAVAVARHYQESALPALGWLLHNAKDKQRTELARVILATNEDGALPLLLSVPNDKWIRTALDGAAKDHPARTFCQCLRAMASGRTDLSLKGQVMEFVKDRPPETLRQWAGTDANVLGQLERVLHTADVALAAPEAWPDVLRDPPWRKKAKIAKLPDWFVPSALSRPELVSGGALPDEAMAALTEMLSFITPDAVYAGIDIVKQQTTKRSLGAFAWDLFSAWLASGAPSKDGWAMRAVGWLGDDECARQLTGLIRKWPGESAHARAVTGLDVLADIGSDIALMNLNGIAEKLKYRGLQEKAREKIAALAEARDLSSEELADRLVPDLDLDERGGLDLVFGERRFRAGFDEFLKPWVRDSTGQRLKDLPKPNNSDDPELSAAAVRRWSALKKDARAIASLQLIRLEAMLSTSRRIRPDVFWLFFAAHPLIRHLTQRLVWGVYADDDPRTAPTMIFRVADDLSVTDASDEALELDVSETAPGMIGLVHPLHLPAGGVDAWGALLSNYEIAQPFPQLEREIYELTDAEKAGFEIRRFEGIKVKATRIRSIGSLGWRLGDPHDGGLVSSIERQVRLEDGAIKTAMLDLAEGCLTTSGAPLDKPPKLGKLILQGRHGAREYSFDQLDPVTASEMLRGPHLLVASESK